MDHDDRLLGESAASESSDPVVHSDVIVVGAGVVGLATAWELSRRGLAVTLMDPAPGSGASRAAAGMIAPASEVAYRQEPLYPLMAASAAEYREFVTAVETAARMQVGYRGTETLVVAAHRGDMTGLRDLAQVQTRHGMDVELLTARRARALEPALSPRISGAVRAGGDHQVDPRRLVTGLLAALGTAGATVVRSAAAEVMRRSGGGHAVRTADGRLAEASAVVLAPGLGLAGIAGVPSTLELPLRPVYGDVVRTRVPAGAPPLIERTVRGVVDGVPVYLVPRADGEVVIGATSREDAQPAASTGGVWRLLDDARTLVPGVVDLEFGEAIARARPGTPDDLPYVGAVRDEEGSPVPGLFVSTGHFRHGILLAPLAARLLGQLVTGQGVGDAADAAHLTATDPHRHAGWQAGAGGQRTEAARRSASGGRGTWGGRSASGGQDPAGGRDAPAGGNTSCSESTSYERRTV